MVSAPQRRWAVSFLKMRQVSERRACTLVQMARSSFQYQVHPKDDTALVERLKDIARKPHRFGYRRAWAMLRRGRDQLVVNHKRVYRLWRANGLCLPRRRPRRPRPGQGAVPCIATHPNHVWTYDFMFDTCANGQKLKILTVLDEYTRESLAIRSGTRFNSKQVIEVLVQLFRAQGAPDYLRSDNGPEFIAKGIRKWLADQGAETQYIEPGCPWQNAYGESFNGKFRDECLNMEVFLNPAEAQVRFEAWRRYYNTERPHSSLGYLTPAEFHAAWDARQAAEEGGLNSAPKGVATARGEQVVATVPETT